jgi:Flp pilus assembly protein CpaB
MNNFVIGFKKFITNKNVVTVIGVLAVLGILFWGYTSSIKKETNPLNIPVAAKTITATTQITSEDVTYIQVANRMVGEGVIRSSAQIIGKYTNINVTIPKGSVFYADWVVDAERIPGNWIEQLDYEAGELGYYMDVNIENTLGNNVLPNTYIDIYMKANDENGTTMFGKLLKNIKVLVVHDASGNNVFQDSASIGNPSKIGFAVSQDLYVLLKKAEYLNIDLVLAPRGSTVPSKDYIIVTSATLRDYIDAQTITVEEDIIEEEIKNPNQEVTNPGENQNQPIVE